MSSLLEIEESRTSDPMHLSEIQVSEIRNLGKHLASKKSFYGLDDEDSLNTEIDNSSEVIKCLPAGSNLYRVLVHNAIGVISLTDLTIHVLPKISMNHFVYLANCVFEEPRSHANRVKVSSLNAFRQVLATWCVNSVERLLKSGLTSEYQEVESELPIVRGRVNTTSTTLKFLRGRVGADCRFDDLDIDNPLNRILKTALYLISNETNVFSGELRAHSHYLFHQMAGVGRARHSDYKVKLERHSHRYVSALDLSLRVIAGSAIDIPSGNVGGQTFLIPTPGLVEAAIRKILESNLAPIQVKKSGRIVSQDAYFSINPDLVFNDGSVTGDVKYKIASANWVRNDVAQAAMFASGFNAKAAVIVTFSNSPGNSDLEMALGNLPLHRITWNSCPDKDPTEAEEEFIARMRAFILPFQSSV